MLKKILCLVSAGWAACAALEAGAQEYLADKVVAVVGNSPILYSQIYELGQQLVQQRREQGYTSDRDPMNEALETLLLRKLLYNQALIDSVEVNAATITEQTETMMNNMIESAGSMTRLEAVMHKPIFEIKEDIRKQYEEMGYAQSMQYEIQDKITITPGEVDRYFRTLDKKNLPIIPDQYVYAQITKLPESTNEAKQRTRERLLDMRARILKGTKFETLASLYSIDPGSRFNGGEYPPSSKDMWTPPFAEALEKLRPGQISEVVETEYGFHIIQLIDKDNGLYHFRHILIKPTFTDDELYATDRTLDSIASLIRADSLSFEKAAFLHSDDSFSKLNGGIVTNNEYMEVSQMYDVKYSKTKFFREEITIPQDYEALRRLKVGEISSAFQSQNYNGDVLSKIIKLVEVIPSHPADLKSDYLRLEEMALEEKKKEEFDRWVDKKIEAMYVYIAPEFREGEFENKNWVK
ncbi:MAG: peptidylprolyl isomerase [Rikenellaceae bacterium]|nr:peptidylprolyl isomerase [Rikenellaceae bacterium]